jgi:hypothetical protein
VNFDDVVPVGTLVAGTLLQDLGRETGVRELGVIGWARNVGWSWYRVLTQSQLARDKEDCG